MNELTVFENEYLPVMASYAELERQMKAAKEKLDEFKKELSEGMDQYDVKSIDNDYIKITRVAASESVSVDLKAFQANEPVEFAQLREDYPKVTKRKESMRIVVK